jgi:hypothetical protein
MANTRTPRNPENFHIVQDGFTPISWPQVKVQFPDAANAILESQVDYEEEEKAGDDALWDDELFIAPDGRLTMLSNITGPGGAFWMMWFPKDGIWDEVIIDESGEIEVF